MGKVVINACFGGFGLSDAGMRRYAQLRGHTLYPEADKYGLVTYWIVPPDQRPAPLPEPWGANSLEARKAYNDAYTKGRLYSREFDRDDPVLIRVVEELGVTANGDHAELRIVEVPDGVEWEISEYDGNEHVAERHRKWS